MSYKKNANKRRGNKMNEDDVVKTLMGNKVESFQHLKTGGNDLRPLHELDEIDLEDESSVPDFLRRNWDK